MLEVGLTRYGSSARCGHRPLGDATLHRNVTSDRQARRDKTEAGDEQKGGVTTQERAEFHLRALFLGFGSSVRADEGTAHPQCHNRGPAASLVNGWLTNAPIAQLRPHCAAPSDS